MSAEYKTPADGEDFRPGGRVKSADGVGKDVVGRGKEVREGG